MSEGAFVVYQHAVQAIANGAVPLESGTLSVSLLASAYSPSAVSDSAWADIQAFQVPNPGYEEATVTPAETAVTRPSNDTVRFDITTDLTFSAAYNMDFKYVVIRYGDIPVAYCDCDTTSDQAKLTLQKAIVQFATDGVFEIEQEID